MQSLLWAGFAGAVAMAGLDNWADKRRARRHDPDAVGLMPWPSITIVAIFAAAICAALAFKG